jgi:RNA polymerase sigma-70 factor (ECF subfamily)
MGELASLARVLLASLDAARALALAPRAASLEAALRRADAEGRAAWPALTLAPEAFAGHIADRVRARSDVEAAIAALHAADLFLACACTLGVPAALRALELSHVARIPALVRRVDPSSAFADEVVQEVRDAVLVPRAPGEAPRIAEYSGRGALAGWMRVVAVRTALRLRKERRAAGDPLDGEAEVALPGVVDPELDQLKLRYRRAYEEAVEAALAALADRDALLLKLHYVDGLGIDRIGALLGVDRSTVARRRAALRLTLLASVREQLRQRIAVTDSEFDSLLAVVRSQLEPSIRAALLRPRPEGSDASP